MHRGQLSIYNIIQGSPSPRSLLVFCLFFGASFQQILIRYVTHHGNSRNFKALNNLGRPSWKIFFEGWREEQHKVKQAVDWMKHWVKCTVLRCAVSSVQVYNMYVTHYRGDSLSALRYLYSSQYFTCWFVFHLVEVKRWVSCEKVR